MNARNITIGRISCPTCHKNYQIFVPQTAMCQILSFYTQEPYDSLPMSNDDVRKRGPHSYDRFQQALRLIQTQLAENILASYIGHHNCRAQQAGTPRHVILNCPN